MTSTNPPHDATNDNQDEPDWSALFEARDLAEVFQGGDEPDWGALSATRDLFAARTQAGFIKVLGEQFVEADRRVAEADRRVAEADRRVAEAERQAADAEKRLERLAELRRQLAEAERQAAAEREQLGRMDPEQLDRQQLDRLKQRQDRQDELLSLIGLEIDFLTPQQETP